MTTGNTNRVTDPRVIDPNDQSYPILEDSQDHADLLSNDQESLAQGSKTHQPNGISIIYKQGMGKAINQTYTAVVKRDGEWWIGWVEEVPGVNAQEVSRELLLTSLREVLSEALVMNREEARQAAGAGYEEFALTL